MDMMSGSKNDMQSSMLSGEINVSNGDMTLWDEWLFFQWNHYCNLTQSETYDLYWLLYWGLDDAWTILNITDMVHLDDL